jgi:hypothetical protein
VQTLRYAQEAGAAQLATKADLAQVRGELKSDLAEVRGELTLVKRMLGFNLALSVAVLLRLLVP